MKIVLLLLALSLVIFWKNKRHRNIGTKRESKYFSRGLVNISELYTINYQSHYIINRDIINFTDQEQNILNLINSEEFKEYNFYVVGGWVRDKVLNRVPADMDIVVDAYTMKNLENIVKKMFEIIERNESENSNRTNRLVPGDQTSQHLTEEDFSVPGNKSKYLGQAGKNYFRENSISKNKLTAKNFLDLKEFLDFDINNNVNDTLGNNTFPANLNTQNQTDFLNPSQTHIPLDPVRFRRPFKIKNYGKITFTIYGMDIDLEILSKKRVITPEQEFIPTSDVKDDALIRDLKINAMFYDVRNKIVIDPLNGLDDLQNGIIDLPLGEKTFIDDYLRVFSIIKTSSKLSIKISDFISNLIKNNLQAIKIFMLGNREEIINFKLKKIIQGDFSLKAFKLLYDMNLYDPCIPKIFYEKFNLNQLGYSTEIFNMIALCELLSKINFLSLGKLDLNEKFLMYIEAFRLEFENFGNYEKLIEGYKNQRKFNEKFNPREYLLSISKLYCEYNDCKTTILSNVQIDKLNLIINNLNNDS